MPDEGIDNCTSVPSPGPDRMTTAPPYRAMRALIDCAIPWRSAAPQRDRTPGRDHGRTPWPTRRRPRRRTRPGGAGPLGRVDGGFPGRIEERAHAVGERTVTDGHHLDGDAVIGFHLALEEADPLDEHGGVLADGAGSPPVEEPLAELAFLGARQPHHVLPVAGRSLDESEGLETESCTRAAICARSSPKPSLPAPPSDRGPDSATTGRR